MARVFDCFLYRDEAEALSIRLSLLSPVVDVFVIVTADETFTGKRVPPSDVDRVVASVGMQERVRHLRLDHLEGSDAWARETYSRNALGRLLHGADGEDWVMISDVDEIPRPCVISDLRKSGSESEEVVLVLDYYNFKFNYQLLHGVQAAWAGPVLCRRRSFVSAQEHRCRRWTLFWRDESRREQAGWHFSFLTTADDVSNKLDAFSHQEAQIQGRRVSIAEMVASRAGFHDHIHPGAVWAVVAADSYGCPELESAVRRYPTLLVAGEADSEALVRAKIRKAMYNVIHKEQSKLLPYLSWDALAVEIARRAGRRLRIRRRDR